MLILILGCVAAYFVYRIYKRMEDTSVPQVEVDSGVESVLLPCRTTVQTEGVRVEWTDRDDRKVHVYHNGSDQPAEHFHYYRGRTLIKGKKTGNLSLTLKRPTDRDSGTYTCTVYNMGGDILVMKRVHLKVKVCRVEVEEGVESVLLPFKTMAALFGDTIVEWRREEPEPVLIVHHHGNTFHQPVEPDNVYRGRTQMNINLLGTGDASLTLQNPTVPDSGTYKCLVEQPDKKPDGSMESMWRIQTVLLTVRGKQQNLRSHCENSES